MLHDPPILFSGSARAKLAAQFSGMGLPMVLLITLGLLVSGCSFLLPTTQGTVKSKWQSFNEAKGAFDQVVPGETTINQLAGLGFDPAVNPNVRILTYLDIIQRFMPNESITKQDLDPSVRAFIEHREAGQAWVIEVNHTKSKRYGNALLDVTGFVKKTHETGWQFNGLVLILEGQVVYKLSSGQPSVDRYDKKVRPLGPLQELDSIIARTVGAVADF